MRGLKPAAVRVGEDRLANAVAGLLRASLVLPKPIRDLRDLTRYRNAQIRDRQREANRLHKVMQDTGIKLDSAHRTC